MKLNKLTDSRPEPYISFLAYDDETKEYFDNFLVYSEFNKFYVAGKRFTHWLKVTNNISI